jgi:N-dimethylarginine dimethylaminohydrolase
VTVQPLAWGRRYLMCRPDHFRVDYAINPWMDVDATLDTERALAQWDNLAATLESAGAVVERIVAHEATPDMVYAMNYGLVDGDHVAITNFRFEQRRPESESAEWWFGERGYRTTRVADTCAGAFEAGDAFLFGSQLIAAAGPRTDLVSHAALRDVFDVRVASVQVVHPALYHLDLSFCPLDETKAIVAPAAWDAAGRATVSTLVPEPLVIDEEEAYTFCANSVVVGDVVVMPQGSPLRVARTLERWGFTVGMVDVGELHKGGGSIRCMTLPLDTRLDAARIPSAAIGPQRGRNALLALD